MKKIEGVQAVNVRPDGEWSVFTIRPTAGADPREEIYNLAVSRQWPIRELSRSEVTLEQVFAEVTHAEEI